MREQHSLPVYAQDPSNQPAIRANPDGVSLNVVGEAATGFAFGVGVGALAALYLLSQIR